MTWCTRERQQSHQRRRDRNRKHDLQPRNRETDRPEGRDLARANNIDSSDLSLLDTSTDGLTLKSLVDAVVPTAVPSHPKTSGRSHNEVSAGLITRLRSRSASKDAVQGGKNLIKRRTVIAHDLASTIGFT